MVLEALGSLPAGQALLTFSEKLPCSLFLKQVTYYSLFCSLCDTQQLVTANFCCFPLFNAVSLLA